MQIQLVFSFAIVMNILNVMCTSINQLEVQVWKPFKFKLSDATGLLAGAASSVVASGGLTAVLNPAFGGLPTASVLGLISGGAASVNTLWGN